MTADALIETHMSRVWLRGDRVYKRLKPVRYPFADFSTPAKRRAACEAELTHNGPWAPGVYLRVLPVPGDPPDWEIEMVRLPDDARLRETAEHVEPATMERIGARIREVHDASPLRAGAARPDAVRARILENLDELVGFDLPLDAGRLREVVTDALVRADDALEARAGTGRLLHGDLRTEHVYLLPDRIAVLDGVAFNPALAEGDPAEDVAFLAMELGCVHGRWDLEESLWRGWRGGEVPAVLRDLYTGHRSLIRAKIAAIGGRAERVGLHLVHALARLEAPGDRPALVGVGGLPGVGKSALAASLERHLGFEVLRSDVVRKEADAAPSYALEARNAVYDALFARAAERLAEGARVLIDASFGREAWRLGLLDAAKRAGVRGVLLFGDAPEAVVEARLASRVDDASDADIRVYRRARDAWEPASARTRRASSQVDTGQSREIALDEAIRALAAAGLADTTHRRTG